MMGIIGIAAAISTAPAPPLSYQEAQSLPVSEVAGRVLVQFASTVVEARKLRPDSVDDLRLATRPRADVYPGLCESQFIDVSFTRTFGSGERDVHAGSADRLSLKNAYRVVGDVESKKVAEEYEGELAALEARCRAEPNVLGFFEGPDALRAYTAARVVERVARAARSPEAPSFQIVCRTPNPECGIPLLRHLTSIDPREIRTVETEYCAPSNRPTLCFSVSVSDRSGDGRSGWIIHAVVRGEMKNSDVVSFWEFKIDSIRIDGTYDMPEMTWPNEPAHDATPRDEESIKN